MNVKSFDSQPEKDTAKQCRSFIPPFNLPHDVRNYCEKTIMERKEYPREVLSNWYDKSFFQTFRVSVIKKRNQILRSLNVFNKKDLGTLSSIWGI